VVASYEAPRFATVRKNGLHVEINGSLGSLVFDFERMNELQFYSTEQPVEEQGFTRILVTEPSHPYMSAWWPPGHIIGYEHSFTHTVRDFLQGIVDGKSPRPDFDDGLRNQRVLDAIEKSATSGQWTKVA
jgi:predicted dehydrogenase